MKKLIQRVLILLSFIVVILACNSDDFLGVPTSNKDSNPVLKDNVKIIDKSTLQLDLTPSQIEAGMYKFTFTSETLTDFKTGNVIIGEEGGGFIRKVSSVTREGKIITLQTTQGNMSDVFKEGSFNFNLAMNNMQNKTSESGFSYTITNQSIYNQGALSIVLDVGQVDFNPNWFFDFSFDKNGITNFEMSAKNGTLNGNFTATVTASQAITLINKTSSILPGGKPYTKSYTKWVPAVLLGVPVVVPITVVMGLDLVLDYSATMNAAITRQANFISTNTFDLGIKYTNGQWNGINSLSPNNTFTLSKRIGNANATINLALTPKVSFKLYGQAGPYASVSLQEELKASVASPALDWDFNADVWLKTIVGASASILDYELANYNKTWETEKLSYLTPYKIEIVSGNDQNGEFGKQLPNPLKVRIVDNLDNVWSNVPVYFTVTEGGGKVQITSIMTDLNGFAQTDWTLGNSGIQRVSVSARKANGTNLLMSPVTFLASGLPLIGAWIQESFENGIPVGEFKDEYNFSQCPNILTSKFSVVYKKLVLNENGTWAITDTSTLIQLNKQIEPNDCSVVKDNPDVKQTLTDTATGTYVINGNIIKLTQDSKVWEYVITFISNNKIKIEDMVFVRQ
jgi:hypothetical protein